MNANQHYTQDQIADAISICLQVQYEYEENHIKLTLLDDPGFCYFVSRFSDLFYGRTFRSSRRTNAMIGIFIEIAARKQHEKLLSCLQKCYGPRYYQACSNFDENPTNRASRFASALCITNGCPYRIDP